MSGQRVFLKRELLKVCVLITVTVAAFFGVRAAALSSRATTVQDAESWYQRGEERLAARDYEAAVDALRRAANRNREDGRYALALAGALAARRDFDAAGAVLLALREVRPEDRDVNLALARVGAGRHDVTEAVRYYHNALYAVWPADQADARRKVRLELIRFLLAHDQSREAISELVALTADWPDRSPLRVDVALAFEQAGDSRRALEQFQRLLRDDAADPQALAGAGRAAFAIGDYSLAAAYLRRLPKSATEADVREVVEYVLSYNPLAPRIGAVERRRRLAGALVRARARLVECVERGAGADGRAVEEAPNLQAGAGLFLDALRRKNSSLDQDTIESGLEWVARLEQAARCDSPSPLDRALVLLAHRATDEMPR